MYLKFATTLPLALAIAACGEPMDGSDTADMTNDAVTADTGNPEAEAVNPASDGMLDTEVEAETATGTEMESADEMMMEEHGSTDSEY